jgi:hypothetical protein
METSAKLEVKKVIEACDSCLDDIYEDREIERIRDWDKLVKHANFPRKLLNKIPGVNLRLKTREDVPTLNVGPLLVEGHHFLYGRQEQAVASLKELALATEDTFMHVSVNDFHSIRTYYGDNEGSVQQVSD